MKKLLFIFLIYCVFGATPVLAQGIGFYPIVGDVVSDVSGVAVDGRTIYFYQTHPDLGRTEDIIGPSGAALVAARFALNAFGDWRMEIIPGKYYVATVNTDGYGAGPVEVMITGKGYEIVSTLHLVPGGGVAPGLPIPPAPWEAYPRIEKIKFGERLYQPQLITETEKFIVSSQPKISARVTCPLGINTNSIRMVQAADIEKGIPEKTYNVRAASITTVLGAAPTPTEISFIYDFKAEGETLPDGDQTLTFRAQSASGLSTQEVTRVSILAGALDVIGEPIAFPSPAVQGIDKQVTLQYGLSKDGNVDIYIFDISARILKKFSFNAGEPGGQAGGTINPNKVTWNLITDQGDPAPAGILLFNIVDRDNNKVLKKGKITLVTKIR
jgi:hypothetical protein